MTQEMVTVTKKNSKDIKNMLPPHLRNKGSKNKKFSSPLKNHVEIKDDKSSISSNNGDDNVIINNDIDNNMIGRSKSTNEVIDQQRRNRFYNEPLNESNLNKLNSLNNSSKFKFQQMKLNYLNTPSTNNNINPMMNGGSKRNSEQYIFNEDLINENVHPKNLPLNVNQFRSSFIEQNRNTSVNNNNLSNFNINNSIISTSPTKSFYSSSFPTQLTINTTPVANKRRSLSLPTSPMDMMTNNSNNRMVRMNTFGVLENFEVKPKDTMNHMMNHSVQLSRSTSRGGSDDKIQQILGDGAVNSFERSNVQLLNESIEKSGNKHGNREKIQQILIDGGNKNKNANNNNNNNGNKRDNKDSYSILPTSPLSTSNIEKLETKSGLNPSLHTNINKLATNNGYREPISPSSGISSSNGNLSFTGLNHHDLPQSILLNGNHNYGVIDRSNSNGSSILGKSNGRQGSIRERKSNDIMNINSVSQISSGSEKSIQELNGEGHSEPQLTFALPSNSTPATVHFQGNLSTKRPSSNSSSTVSEESRSQAISKNGFHVSSGIQVNTERPANIASSIVSPLQNAGPHKLNNDAAMTAADKNRNGLLSYDHNSENDIFAVVARKQQEERRKNEKNKLKISKETQVFSCYIEKLSSRKKFQKRILRFDGVYLICLSQKKKQKLPSNTTFTMVNPPCFSDNTEEGKNYLEIIKKLYTDVSPGPEFSSPLIAVEDSKSKTGNPNLKAKHYYQPKWIINIKNIISVRPLIHPDLLSLSNPQLIYKKIEQELQHYITGDLEKDTKTFIIITNDGTFYVIRAYSEREFNRWLYILTRSKEILEELVDPRLMVPDALPPPPSASPDPNQKNNTKTNNDHDHDHGSGNGNDNINDGSSISSSNVNPEINSIRRFMSREEDIPRSGSANSRTYRSNSRNSNYGRTQALSRSRSHGHTRNDSVRRSGSRSSGYLANANSELRALYTNSSASGLVLKTEYTDLIERKLPKNPLHFHCTVYDYWKGILKQLYAVDKEIFSSVVKAENSELMSILRDSGGDMEQDEMESESNSMPLPVAKPTINTVTLNSQTTTLSSSTSQKNSKLSPTKSNSSDTRSSIGSIPTNLKDKPLINAIPTEEHYAQFNSLRPRPRSGSAPPLSTIMNKYGNRELDSSLESPIPTTPTATAISTTTTPSNPNNKINTNKLSIINNVNSDGTTTIPYKHDKIETASKELKSFSTSTLLPETLDTRASIGGMVGISTNQTQTSILEDNGDINNSDNNNENTNSNNNNGNNNNNDNTNSNGHSNNNNNNNNGHNNNNNNINGNGNGNENDNEIVQRRNTITMEEKKKTYGTQGFLGHDDNLIHDEIYTIGTIEQPELKTIKLTKDNQPMKQHRNSIYSPNATESLRIPSSDPTLKEPLIKSISWDRDLIFTIHGLLRIFHRLSGIPFKEDGESEVNTPPPPIPRWYYQFCVKSIPVYVIQIQNMLIDYLQELEYHQGKFDEIEMIKDDICLHNKTVLSERYRTIQAALDTFIKLSNLWDEIINQWKLEMIQEKFDAETLLISESEVDSYLLQNVQVSDVLAIHEKIKDYVGKEMLKGCRNLLKLFGEELKN
jgi:hypothetical protein